MNKRFGASTTGNDTLDEGVFAAYASAGIGAMEISYDVPYHDIIDWKSARKLSADYSVEMYSYHLPFCAQRVNIAHLDFEVRKRSLALDAECIRRAGDTGVTLAVIHPSGEPIADCDRERAMQYSMEGLSNLAGIASESGVRLAVEDLPRTCLGRDTDELLRLLSADSRLGVCYDTNHITRQRPAEIIAALSGRIIAVHISDFDFIDEKHWMPGEGSIDWTELTGLLYGSGFDGVFMYEVNPNFERKIKRVRKLEYTDFGENFQSLLCGRRPAFLGTVTE